jgi:hypothetical protein
MAFTKDDVVVATGATTTKTSTAAQILTWLAGALAAANLIVAGVTSSGPVTAPSVATTVLTVTSNANIGDTCTAGYFSGNGAALTNLPATAVDVARTWTTTQTFSGTTTLNGTTNIVAGNGLPLSWAAGAKPTERPAALLNGGANTLVAGDRWYSTIAEDAGIRWWEWDGTYWRSEQILKADSFSGF